MDKKLDVIYEEIKREDFFNKIRAALPYIVSGICIILGVTAWHSWRSYRKERLLMETEALYEHGLYLYSKGQKNEAIQIMDKLILEAENFRFLALCQKGIWEKQNKSIAISKRIFYEELKKYYSSVMELLSFFDICHSFDNLNIEASPVDKDNVWYCSFLLREGLFSFNQKNQQKALEHFQQLQNFLSSEFQEGNDENTTHNLPKWMESIEYINHYTTLGSVGFFFESSANKKNEKSYEPIKKSKKKILSRRK